MIRLLQFLFQGCWHKYDIIKKTRIMEKQTDTLPIYTRYTVRCEKCGRITTYNG